MKESKLTSSQFIKQSCPWSDEEGDQGTITVELRYDDSCKNSHNTFSIIGTISGSICWAGAIHKEIAQFFPSIKPYLKWHLCSSIGPMHYIENTLYFVENKETGICLKERLNLARRCAIWPEATDEELLSPDLRSKLEARLPALLEDFASATESLGFTY
jgi:hypothetical protein